MQHMLLHANPMLSVCASHMLTHEGAHATEHRGEGQGHQKARRVLPNLDRPHLHDGDHHCGERGEGIGVDVWMYVCVCVCGRCE